MKRGHFWSREGGWMAMGRNNKVNARTRGMTALNSKVHLPGGCRLPGRAQLPPALPSESSEVGSCFWSSPFLSWRTEHVTSRACYWNHVATPSPHPPPSFSTCSLATPARVSGSGSSSLTSEHLRVLPPRSSVSWLQLLDALVKPQMAATHALCGRPGRCF